MPDPIVHHDFTLEPADSERLANLAGPFDGHLRQIELRLGVEIANRGNVFRISGPEPNIASAEHLLQALYAEAGDTVFDSQAIHLRLNAANLERLDEDYQPQDVAVRVRRGTIRGRGANQARYLHAIARHDINFGIGPAGTGKTENMRSVNFAGHPRLVGQFVEVVITEALSNSLRGRVATAA